MAGFAGSLAVLVAAGLFFSSKGASVPVLATQIALPGLAGTLPGAALGVRVARGFGWHPRWVSGAAIAAVLGLIVIVATLGLNLGMSGS